MSEAKRLRPLHETSDAWYYENSKSVDVYACHQGRSATSCRITRKQLESWLKKMNERTP